MRFWSTPTCDVNHVAEGHPEYILDELHVCNPFQPLSGDLKQVIFWNSQTSRVRGENEGTTCEVKCQMNSMNHQRNGLIKVLKTILFFPEDKNKKTNVFYSLIKPTIPMLWSLSESTVAEDSKYFPSTTNIFKFHQNTFVSVDIELRTLLLAFTL